LEFKCNFILYLLKVLSLLNLKTQNQEIVLILKFILDIPLEPLNTAFCKVFLTPHDSKNLTAVKFFSSAPPQGGS